MSKFNEEKCKEIGIKVYEAISQAIQNDVIDIDEIDNDNLGNEFIIGCIDAIGVLTNKLTGETYGRLDFNHMVNLLIYQAKPSNDE